jgi:hypothetical protein
MLHIDRATDLLVAVCYGPTHARLGEKDGQRAAQPYVFYRLALTGLRPSKAEAERRIDGDDADPEQGGDRREAIQDAALCSAVLGSIISRRWGSKARRACQRRPRPSGGCSPRHRSKGSPPAGVQPAPSEG